MNAYDIIGKIVVFGVGSLIAMGLLSFIVFEIRYWLDKLSH